MYFVFSLGFFLMDLDQRLIVAIVNQFGLSKYQAKDIEVFDFGLKDLELLLATRIKYLMDYDRDALMHSLYRIDIDENSVKMIFRHSKSDLIPQKIAHLIIERTRQKLINHVK
jgi:hypothetical protein